MTRRRAPSSGTIRALTLEARADLWASMRAPEVLDALAEMDADDEDGRRVVLMAWLRRTYLAGGEREADHLSAIETLREQVRRLRGAG